MNVGFPNFAQSLQITSSLSKATFPSMVAVSSRTDALTLNGRSAPSITYQKPVGKAACSPPPESSHVFSFASSKPLPSWQRGLTMEELEERGRVRFGSQAPKNPDEVQRGRMVLAGVQTTNDEMAWAFGLTFSANGLGSQVLSRKLSAEVSYPNRVLRSDKMVIQSRWETTEHTLNQQIDHALKASGISLDEKERLNFNIDQTGKISITGGLGDTDSRKQVLEDMLNSDDSIRSNLFLYQVQKKMVAAKNEWKTGVLSSSFTVDRAYDWAHGNITGIQHDDSIEKLGHCAERHEHYWKSQGFPAEFSFQDGKVFQGDKFPEDRVFSDRLDSLADLGKIIGLDESAATDIQSFVSALERNIAVDTSKLTGLLNAALKQAKLGDVNNKITFAQDAKGNIVVEGNISEKQKKQLAEIINSDSELVELIKTQSAKQAVLDELKASITDEPALYNTRGAWKKHNARPEGFNLTQDSLATAREQLLKNFLDRSGVSLSDLKTNPDAVLANHAELGAIKGLRNEIADFLTQKTTSTEPEPLLAMKRGELVETAEANERLGIDDGVADLKQHLNFWMAEYNKYIDLVMPGRPELQLTGYTVTFDHTGKPNLEIKTADGNSSSDKAAKQYLMTKVFKSGAYQDLALAILDAHDDEHGDVQDYNHSVVIESGVGQYRIESPDADQAALQEMENLTQEISNSFGKMLGIENPFSLIFGADGLLSLNADSLSSFESQAVQKVLDEVNAYLIAKEAGEDTEDMLSEELIGIADKLFALKEIPKKFHDQSLVPKDGLRVGVNG